DSLYAAADFADLLLAALGAGVVHQLHVVDHDALYVVLPFKPAGLGAEVHHGQAGRVVDPHRGLGQLADHVGQVGVLLRLQPPFAELVGVDLPAAAEHTLGELLLAHFQAEHSARQPVVGRDVFHDVHGEGGFTHRRAGGDDDHFAVLQAVHHVVELKKAGL